MSPLLKKVLSFFNVKFAMRIFLTYVSNTNSCFFGHDLERLTPPFFLYTESNIIMAILWAIIGSFLSLYT